MMPYYKLDDDMQIPNRWHIGMVTFSDGGVPVLTGGLRLEHGAALSAALSRSGRVLDYTLSAFYVPIVRPSLARAIAAAAGDDVQSVPVRVPDHGELVALNVLRTVRCLDEGKSEFLQWTERDHRADLAGQYRQVTRLVLDPEAIPADAHFFRVWGWVALIVSSPMKQAMESAGCVGARFTQVTP